MSVVLWVLASLACLFCGFAAYCCAVVGSRADERDKERFKAYMRERDARKRE